MDLIKETLGDIYIIKIDEFRLVKKVADEFRDKMSNIVKTNCKIVLNLEKVEFIDSSGLGAIVTSLKHVGSDGDIYLCNTNEVINQMLKLTRMNRVFKTFDSVEEAVKSFKK